MKRGFALKGFTLIELMVSVAIFTIVMVISLGALLAISAAERKAETLKSVMDNLNFAVESMSRTIRTGVNYHCDTSGALAIPQDCPNQATGASYMVLLANDNTYVAYCLSNNAIWRLRVSDSADVRTSCSALDGFLQITAPEVVISNLTFYIRGAPLGDSIQPKVLISMSGYVDMGSAAPSTFNLQTSVTQRIYDQ